jgi:hypothetical protein
LWNPCGEKPTGDHVNSVGKREEGGCFFYFTRTKYRCFVGTDLIINHHRERGIIVSLRNLLRLVLAVGVCGTAGPVWAYDPSPNIGGDLHACDQVNFSTFTPPPFSAENNVTVAPKSDFSFLASKATTSASITVKIKEEKVPITVTPVGYGFQVKGKLPPSIKGSYIRLDIFAKGPSDCDKTDGWLLKVGN